MKKFFFTLGILAPAGFLLLFLPYPPSDAAVTGPCTKCHTMHNSQNDSVERLEGTKDNPNLYAPITGGADQCIGCHGDELDYLLKLECLGCHAMAPQTGALLIRDGIPQIAHNAGLGLAAGNYNYVFSNTRRGHNVHGFGSNIVTDSELGQTPPGFLAAYDPAANNFNDSVSTPSQIMCSGRNGCHGDRDQLSMVRAMEGTHHADDSILRFGSKFNDSRQGETAGNSYRFLYKVKGIEDDDWMATNDSTDHNEYLGKTYSEVNDSAQTWNTISTISQFCSECHGIFHARYSGSDNDGIGAENAWLRHPSDVVLPNTGEYQNYTNYKINVPIGRQSLTAIGLSGSASATVTPGSDIVTCLSCHKAHGSPYRDILRWNYSRIDEIGVVPDGDGCYACHSEKD